MRYKLVNIKVFVMAGAMALSLGSNAWWWDKDGKSSSSSNGNSSSLVISNEPVPADEAFQYSAYFKSPNMIIANWTIHPENYLYRNKFFVDIKGAEFDEIKWPEGTLKQDPLFGDVQVHKGELAVELPLKDITGDEVELTVKYQGCWVGGVCYPPMEKVNKIKVLIRVLEK